MHAEAKVAGWAETGHERKVYEGALHPEHVELQRGPDLMTVSHTYLPELTDDARGHSAVRTFERWGEEL